jgi:hypothetical protein
MITSGAELRRKQSLEADVTCPSGHVFRLRRPPLKAWGALGLPAFFAKDVREAWAEVLPQDAQSPASRPSLEEQERRGKVYFAFLQYAFVAPRLVEGEPEDDEVTLADLSDDIDFLLKWIVIGSPEVPVSSNPEGVQVADLRAFPDGGRREPVIPAGENGADLRGEAVRTA